MKAFNLGLSLWVGMLVGWGGIARAQTPAASLTFQFRQPKLAVYRVEPASGIQPASVSSDAWVKAAPESAPDNFVLFGSRVVLQIQSGSSLSTLLDGSPLTVARTVSDTVYILQAPDAWTAMREAERLGQRPQIIAAYPVKRQRASLQGSYATRPNDPHFGDQWYLENREANGTWLGTDLNVRAAWPFTYGEGITMAVADDGVEMTHPELAPRMAKGLHYNFNNGTTNGLPLSANSMHATAVAGLALAEGNNGQGMIGVAPAARLASWVIFDGNDYLPSDELMMDMFQFHSNVVAVQNHSWGNASVWQLDPSLLEQTGISNAVTRGRRGLGVIMVRAGGNQRDIWDNVNDDGYALNPRVVAVAAVRRDGRAASYSTPGAPLLVAAPSGDFSEGFPGLFTTDRQKSQGYNSSTNEPDYTFGMDGFSGTSAATPQIAGVVALILAANTNLSYRDVQQILIHSARHFDRADPDLTTNGAGFAVSHNDGFGVPDAGLAVRLARRWINRPPLTQLTLVNQDVVAIPDDGLRVMVGGEQTPENLRSLHASPGQGPHPDAPTASLPLVDVGMATNDITGNLTGHGALIQRGDNTFAEKIQKVAGAGAAFAVIYNNRDVDQRTWMASTSFVPIPAVFINQTDGEALRDFLSQHPNTPVQLGLESARFTFEVTNTLSCEHVAVRLETDHPRRGDLRLTLLSPAGTRSVLQEVNSDMTPGPTDWTYYSTHHFYESSAGIWTVEVTDEETDSVGSVLSVSLIVTGVAITDTDHDGLDDAWEMKFFQALSARPQDDPDGDGYSNLREQIMGTDPLVNDFPFQVDVSAWNADMERLSWPGTTNLSYQIWAENEVYGKLSLVTNLPGRFPETEWFTPSTNGLRQFFRIRAVPGK